MWVVAYAEVRFRCRWVTAAAGVQVDGLHLGIRYVILEFPCCFWFSVESKHMVNRWIYYGIKMVN
jgi:hypothetical protein